MYIETTRPINDYERWLIEYQVMRSWSLIYSMLFYLSVIIAVDNLRAFYLQSPIYTGFAIFLVAVYVLLTIDGLIEGIRLRQNFRPLRKCESVVELRVTAHSMMCIGTNEWFICEVGNGRLIAISGDTYTWSRSSYVVFDFVMAQASGVIITHKQSGTSYYPIRNYGTLKDHFPERAARKRIIARLRERRCFEGTLDDLTAALSRLGEPDTPTQLAPLPPSYPNWDRIQSAIEDRFPGSLGAGRLFDDMSEYVGEPTPLTVGEMIFRFYPDPGANESTNRVRRKVLRDVHDALVDTLRIPRTSIVLTMRLDELFPLRQRRKLWDKFRRQLYWHDLPASATEPADWIRWIWVSGFILGVGIDALILKSIDPVLKSEWTTSHSWKVPVLFCSIPVLLMILGYFLPLWAYRKYITFRFPDGMTTVENIVQSHCSYEEANGVNIVRPPLEEIEAVVHEFWSDKWYADAIPDVSSNDPTQTSNS